MSFWHSFSLHPLYASLSLSIPLSLHPFPLHLSFFLSFHLFTLFVIRLSSLSNQMKSNRALSYSSLLLFLLFVFFIIFYRARCMHTPYQECDERHSTIRYNFFLFVHNKGKKARTAFYPQHTPLCYCHLDFAHTLIHQKYCNYFSKRQSAANIHYISFSFSFSVYLTHVYMATYISYTRTWYFIPQYPIYGLFLLSSVIYFVGR